jgi:hypothetical protein
MTFTESNIVEQMILDTVPMRTSREPSSVWEISPGYADSLSGELRPTRWDHMPAVELPRQNGDVMVEPRVREALIKHNTVKRMISDGAAKGGAEVPG